MEFEKEVVECDILPDDVSCMFSTKDKLLLLKKDGRRVVIPFTATHDEVCYESTSEEIETIKRLPDMFTYSLLRGF